MDDVTVDEVPVDDRLWGEQQPWLAGIARSPTEPLRGAGVLCTDRHVLTCAHVIAYPAPQDAPTEPVYVWFEYHDADPIPADVVVWAPAEDEDVAVLQLQAPPPSRTAPAPLRSVRDGVQHHRVQAYGYPEGHERPPAVPWHGTISGHPRGRLILQTATPQGFSIEHGFSGAPLWDHELRGVTGLVAWRERTRRPDNKSGYVDPRVGLAIPIDIVPRYWPDLYDQIAGGPTRRERFATLTALPVGTAGELPQADQVDIYHDDVGVASCAYRPPHDPYVPRADLDDALERALAEQSFVLVVGPSETGKTRTAIEAVRRVKGAAAFVVPRDAAALGDLAHQRLPVGPQGAVVWLDDLDRYLVYGGLDRRETLDRFRRHSPPIVVVATMTTSRHDKRTESKSEVLRGCRSILDHACLVGVDDGTTDAQRHLIAELYPDVVLGEEGLARHLMAAGARRRRYCTGPQGCPEGWAVLQAAIDWRRMGLDSPVPEPVLRQLYPPYLEELDPDEVSADARFEAGLAWATEPVAGGIPLLAPISTADGVRYRASDYLVELAQGDDPSLAREVRAESWGQVVAAGDAVSAEGMLAVAFAAALQGVRDVALEAAEQTYRRGDSPELRAWSALVRGELELPFGDVAAAHSWLTQAAESGVVGAASWAQVDLAVLRLDAGQTREAADLLDAALATNDPDVRLLAKANVGVLRIMEGDLEAAQALLENVAATGAAVAAPIAQVHLGTILLGRERAAKPQASTDLVNHGAANVRLLQSIRQSGHSTAVHSAQTNLGWLLIGQGEPARAHELLDAVLNSGDPRWTPLAHAGLGVLMIAGPDPERGREHLLEALESGHPYAALRAQLGLAELAYRDADLATACDLLEVVAGAGHLEYSPMAADLLGDLLAAEGEVDRAQTAYQQAIDSGHRDWVPTARIDLAVLLGGQDDDAAFERARQLFDEVIGAQHRDHYPQAADLLGDLLASRADVTGARAAYQLAIGSGHPLWADMARVDLAELLLEQRPEQRAEAVKLLETVATGGNHDLWPKAVGLIGNLAAEDGDIVAARAAYGRVIDADHPFWTPRARMHLGMLSAESDDLDEAQAQFRVATSADDLGIRVSAYLMSGLVAVERGEREQARRDLSAALGSGLHEIDAHARFHLAKLAMTDGALDEAADQLTRMSEQLVEWRGIPAPAVDDAIESRDARYLAACDHLYGVGEMSEAADFVQLFLEAEGITPAAEAGARARLGRACLHDGHFSAAESHLRAALDLSETLEPRARLTQALARRFLALVLIQRHSEPRPRDLAEARTILQPVVTEAEPDHQLAVKHLLGRIAVLAGRRLQTDGDLEAAARSFDDAEALLRSAVDQAQRLDDRDTEQQAREDLTVLLSLSGAGSGRLPAGAGASAHPDIDPATTGPAGVLQRRTASSGEGLPTALLVLLAEVAAAEGGVDEAAEWLTRAERIGEQLTRARLGLAWAAVFLERGCWPEAAEHAARAKDDPGLRTAAESMLGDIALLRPSAS